MATPPSPSPSDEFDDMSDLIRFEPRVAHVTDASRENESPSERPRDSESIDDGKDNTLPLMEIETGTISHMEQNIEMESEYVEELQSTIEMDIVTGTTDVVFFTNKEPVTDTERINDTEPINDVELITHTEPVTDKEPVTDTEPVADVESVTNEGLIICNESVTYSEPIINTNITVANESSASPVIQDDFNISKSEDFQSSDQLDSLLAELKKTKNILLKQEENVTCYKLQRDEVVDERNTLMEVVSRLNSEIQYLKDIHTRNSAQLKNIMNVNCELVSKNGELKMKELSLKRREELLDKERSIFNDKIHSLTAELNKSNLELEFVHMDQSSKISTLEIQLDAKSKELEIADSDLIFLRKERIQLMGEVEKLNQKLLDQRESENAVSDDMRKKIAAKNKIVDLYKSMRDDSESKCEELKKGVTELQTLLKEAVEKYGELETKNITIETEMQNIIKEKDNKIEALKNELEQVENDLKKLKTDSLYSGLIQLSPTAAIARDFLKSGKSLTEIYSEFVTVSDELSVKKDEYVQLKKAFMTLVQELEENAPHIMQRNLQYEDALDSNSIITQKLESVEIEHINLKEQYAETVKLSNHFERENKKLRSELKDLGQQVCFLLKEIDVNKREKIYNNKDKFKNNVQTASSQLITENLVSFKDIQELQNNNQKLLKLIRELSEKHEESEILMEELKTGELQSKLEDLNEKVNELTSLKELHMQKISMITKQKDMYKNLYHEKINVDNLKSNSENKNHVDISDVIEMDESSKIKVLEVHLEDTKKQISLLKEEYSKYEEMSDSKEKILLGQVEKLRKEFNSLNEIYRKCLCSLESSNERNKLLHSDLMEHKKSNAKLIEQNEKYTSKIAEQEMSLKYMREKITTSESKLSHLERMIKNMKKECQFLRDSNSSLLAEKDHLVSEIQEQSALIETLENIKHIIERKDNVDKIKFEEKLELFSRECSLLHRKLQEKQSKLSNMFPSHIHTKMLENGSELEHVKLELTVVHKKLEEKCKELDELINKYSSEEYSNSIEEIKKLKQQLNDQQIEINTLQQQLLENKKHSKLLSNISESAENEMKSLNKVYSEYKSKMEIEVKEYQEQLINLKDKCSELDAELSLQTDNQSEVNRNLNLELQKAKDTIHSLNEKILLKNDEIKKLNHEINDLSRNVHLANEKIVDVSSMHESTVSMLDVSKKKLSNLESEIDNLRKTNNDIIQKMTEHETISEDHKKILLNEKEKLEIHLSDLKDQNSLLHDQLEVLNAQFVLSHSSQQTENVNDSISSERLLNVSFEDDLKSHFKLMQLIKYLRKERDGCYSKYDTIRQENVKIKSDLEIANNMISEMQMKTLEKNVVDNSVITKHSEIMQKLDTFDVVSHSNAMLREERDNLLNRINELSKMSLKLEESLSSLQISNQELTKRVNELSSDNVCNQAECNKWKSNFNALKEKTSKTNTEDWKRLQNERETLAKIITAEKETVKKLREDIVVYKIEKSKLEEQNNLLSKQQILLSEEIKKQSGDINVLKKDLTQVTSELSEMKSTAKEKESVNAQLSEDVAKYLTTIKELHIKELQLRRLAKNYKNQFEQLSKSVEENKEKSDTKPPEIADNEIQPENYKQIEEKMISMENEYTQKVSEFESRISTAIIENNNLQKEIDELRSEMSDIEENAKQKLKQITAQLILLTEDKDDLVVKLKEANTKVDIFEQNRDEHDDRLTALKSQYEGRILKLEKERTLLHQEQQNEVVQLNKQIETLSLKVNQMQKQIDNQQISKQATGSAQGDKTNVEPPTANIKPMSGSQQPMGNRRLVGETPLASIRPMTSVSGVRTAAVLPNAQYSTAVHHLSSHTIDTNLSSPSSSHIVEFTPSSSSVGSRHPNLSSCSQVNPPESTQDIDGEMDTTERCESLNTESISVTSQQTIALVTPRIELSPSDHQTQQAPSTSANNGSNSTVTTSYVTGNVNENFNQLVENSSKRSRTDLGEEKGSFKKQKIQKANECESEYQVPTSSQKDDGVIVVLSDDDDDDNDEEDEDDDDDDESEQESPNLYITEEALSEENDDVDEDDVEGLEEADVIEDEEDVDNEIIEEDEGDIEEEEVMEETFEDEEKIDNSDTDDENDNDSGNDNESVDNVESEELETDFPIVHTKSTSTISTSQKVPHGLVERSRKNQKDYEVGSSFKREMEGPSSHIGSTSIKNSEDIRTSSYANVCNTLHSSEEEDIKESKENT